MEPKQNPVIKETRNELFKASFKIDSELNETDAVEYIKKALSNKIFDELINGEQFESLTLKVQIVGEEKDPHSYRIAKPTFDTIVEQATKWRARVRKMYEEREKRDPSETMTAEILQDQLELSDLVLELFTFDRELGNSFNTVQAMNPQTRKNDA